MTLPISQDLFNRMVEYIENNQPYVFWDRNEHLSEEQVEALLESNDAMLEVENMIWELCWDHISHLETQLLEYVVEMFIDEIAVEMGFPEDFPGKEDYYLDFALDDYSLTDPLLDHIYVDLNLSELMDRQSIYANVVVDIDGVEAISSGWGFTHYNVMYEDCIDLMDFFNVNPRQVAEMMTDNDEQLSTFPDLPQREGHELVSPRHLVEMWINHTTEIGDVTFMVDHSLSHFVENRDKYEQGVLIKGGTAVTFHDSWNGACGLFGRTRRDIVLNKGQFRIRQDGSYGYGLHDICGLVRGSVWDTNLDYATTNEEGVLS